MPHEKKWVETRLNELGKKKGDLAKALGLPHSRISQLINSTRKLQLSEVDAFTRFMRMSRNDVIDRFGLQTGVSQEQPVDYLPEIIEYVLMNAPDKADKKKMVDIILSAYRDYYSQDVSLDRIYGLLDGMMKSLLCSKPE